MRLDRKKFLLALLFVALLAFVSVGAFAQQDEEIKMVWDDSHESYHYSGRNSILISDLEGQGVIVDAVSTGLNTSLLSGYSILVITNPANPLSPDEISAVAQFVQGGGALILLGDMQYGGNTFGQPDSLNAILEGLEIADKVRFWGTNDQGDEIYDDDSKVLNWWQPIVESKYFTPHTIAVGIKKVAINSASLEATSEVVMATSSPTSFTMDVNDVRHRSGRIPWLVALEVGEGKVVVCGSSKMFSDREIYGTGQAYINYEDNEKLFFNFIWWLTGQRLVAPAAITTFFPFLDILGFMAGFFAVHNFKRDTRKLGIYLGLVGIFYMVIAIGQSLIAGNIYFGTAMPGWGQTTVGLETENLPFKEVPAWVIAAAKYFFAGVIFSAAGVIYFMIVLRFAAEYGTRPTEVFGWLAGWPLLPLAGSLLLLIGGGNALSVGFGVLTGAEELGLIVSGLLELLIGFLLILSGFLMLKIRYLMAGTVIASVLGLTGIILFIYVKLIHAQLTGIGFVLEGIVPVVAGILGFLGLTARQKTTQR